MKKMRKLTSLLLVLVMSLALCVPALAIDMNVGGYAGKGECQFSVGAGEVRALAGFNFTKIIPPSGAARITAKLCDSTGKVLQSRNAENSTGAYFFASTWGYGGADAYAAKGVISIYGETKEIPGVDKYGNPFNRSSVLQASLGRSNGYSVNSRGETYGSTLLAEVVGYEPDLISAVGVDGVEGYIRYEDVCPNTFRMGEIPLYDQEGTVIGTFLNGI